MLGIYCRISQEKEEGKDKSIKEQRLRGIALANKLGMDSLIYIDEGVSGTWDIKDRPEFSRMLDAIQEGKLSAIYAIDQSRLERNPQVRFVFNQILKDNNVRLFVDSGEVDLHNDESEMLGDMMSVFNQYYVRITTKKIKNVIYRNISEGKIHGILPYGYMADKDNMFVINPDESDVVKLIYKMHLEGNGFIKIANELNRRNMPTRYNKLVADGGNNKFKKSNQFTGEITEGKREDTQWGYSSVRLIIKNEVYKGVRRFGDNVYECPAYFDEDYWNKVQKCTKKNKNKRGKNADHKYLLNGVCYCGKCGRRMTGRIKAGGSSVYRCVGYRGKDKCKSRGMMNTVLEKIIWDRLFIGNKFKEGIRKYLKTSKNDKDVILLMDRDHALQKSIEGLKRKKRSSIELTIDGILSKEDIKDIVVNIDRELKDLDLKRQQLKKEIEYHNEIADKAFEVVGDINNIKNNLPHKSKRELIKKYIKGVYIVFKNNYYYILVEYHLDIPDEEYVVDIQYRIAVEEKARMVLFLSKDYQDKMGAVNAEVSKWEYIKDKVVTDTVRASLEFDRTTFNRGEVKSLDLI